MSEMPRPMNLDIRVQPKAGRNSVEVAEDGTIRVRVTAPPDRGRANDAVVRLLASRLACPDQQYRSSADIHRGTRSFGLRDWIETMRSGYSEGLPDLVLDSV